MPRLSQDRNLPVAITNLRLCSALQYCGALGVANAFDKSSAEYLYIYDDSKLGYTDWTDVAPEFVSKCFVATNPNNNTIVLLPLDHRILTGKSVVAGGVCDGMLLTEKEMCLIEFKTNATSEWLKARRFTISETCESSVASELRYFKRAGVLKNRSLTVICVPFLS